MTESARTEFSEGGSSLAGWELSIFKANPANSIAWQDVFADEDMTIPLRNPIYLDVDGRPPPFFLREGNYRVVLKDRHGVVMMETVVTHLTHTRDDL